MRKLQYLFMTLSALLLATPAFAQGTEAAGPVSLVPIGAGVGMAIYPQDGETIDALLAVADQALYRVKGRGARKPAGARK